MKISTKVWISSVVVMLLPCIFDLMPIQVFKTMWFLHLVPIFLFSYYFGFRGGLSATLFSIFLHAGWVLPQIYESDGHTSEMLIGVLITISLTKLITLAGIRYITHILETNKDDLEQANKTLMKQAEDLELMAYHDSLTGLPNRYMLNELISFSFIRSRLENQQLAVLFMDLDRFKMVNDTMGHNMGDLLLKQVTERLKRSVRSSDVISRQGGDEFILLLEGVSEAEATQVADRIIHEFATPFMLNDHEFYTSPSIGISLFPSHGEDPETLIKRADQAMYEAKRNGGNGYYIYSIESDSIIGRKIKLEQGLRKALKRNELTLFYQPQIDFATGAIVGVEALIRWRHSELGLVSPAEFIPIAEETGSIIPIGKFVLVEACRQVKQWNEAGYDIRVAINVSPRQFRHKPLVSCVNEAINRVGIKPESLEIEITESIMHNMQESREIMRELKGLGITLSLDDFGTGFSSLNVLSQLPIDIVKIDKSFVDKIGKDPKTSAIIKTIIDLGSTLKFGLVAEGVETEMQAEFLKKLHCDIGQGYLYSKPLPAEEMTALLLNKTLKSKDCSTCHRTTSSRLIS